MTASKAVNRKIVTVFLKVDVDKCSPVGVDFSELIYNIVTEVIVIGAVYLELIQYPVLIKAFFYKSIVVIFNLFHILFFPFLCLSDQYRQELAVLAVNGYHSVRIHAVVINAVAFTYRFNMTAYLELQRSRYYIVHFLTVVY